MVSNYMPYIQNEDTVFIIIAAGDATRWGNHLNTPKHLVEIDGVPIIRRTVALLNNRGYTNIHVVGPKNDDRYMIEGSSLYIPTKNENNMDADKFLNSESLWNKKGRTVVLYGDVYFTEEAMDTITQYDQQSWTLFCRFTPSSYTGSIYGECFAQSFYSEDIKSHKENLLYIAELKREGVIQRCGGWEHYRAMNGIRGKLLDEHHEYSLHVTIDDWTEDFDVPSDYDTFITLYNKQ